MKMYLLLAAMLVTSYARAEYNPYKPKFVMLCRQNIADAGYSVSLVKPVHTAEMEYALHISQNRIYGHQLIAVRNVTLASGRGPDTYLGNGVEFQQTSSSRDINNLKYTLDIELENGEVLHETFNCTKAVFTTMGF